jgi:hypothetical protein
MYANDLWFGQRVQSILDFPFSTVDGVKNGRFWNLGQTAEAFVQTEKTIKGVKLMAAFGVNVLTKHIEQCDHCWGYMPRSWMHDSGPTDGDGNMIAVLTFCNDCYPQEEQKFQGPGDVDLSQHDWDGVYGCIDATEYIDPTQFS